MKHNVASDPGPVHDPCPPADTRCNMLPHPAEPTPTLRPELTRAFLLHHGLCPKGIDADGDLIIAITDKSITGAIPDIGALYNRPVLTELLPRWEVDRLIERVTAEQPDAPAPDAAHHPADATNAANDANTADARDLANQPPVIRYVNLLLRDAHAASASDIHLEATPAGLSVRLRIDGALSPTHEPPRDLQDAILSRIKLLADLDIAERRKPQDGRIRVHLDTRDLDLRVSTIPTMHGESVVLRLLDHGGNAATLDTLGMSPTTLADMLTLCRRNTGMVLVTGPTGSGKTTTLYAALLRRHSATEKIITVEDPIEYQLAGITQMPVHRTATVTFGSALRAILRQDPDVLMIGEMRDAETAELATQAAMTGHLVFSTLHTNDAISSIARLTDLGVPPYAIAATVAGVLAQRLVRRICDHCRTEYAPDAAALRLTPFVDEALPDRLTRGTGCAACRGSGYRGRVGVFELLLIDDDLRAAIAAGHSTNRLRAIAEPHGFTAMATDAWQKVTSGLTTIEEVARVVQT